MSDSNKYVYSIREWAPLTEIFENIPSRHVERGLLFPANLNITCVDAISDYLALGSDAGIVFWYNRQTGKIQKLKAETATRIICVKIVNSVEYMVAAGSSTGQVSVFQIQKDVPPDLNLVAPCTRSKPIQRYTIRDLHRGKVNCCEWSKNGMKLYTGDRNGVIVLTEFDYQNHVSKSMEILSEAYEIIQLSVHQTYLLVSTLYRCIVCQRESNSDQWLITQIGKKDRKQLIDCGGIFLKQNSAANNKYPLLVCGRPGLRFWISDIEGNVEKTLLFKEPVLRSPTWEIPILNPKTINKSMTQMSLNESTLMSSTTSLVTPNNFRNLFLYGDGQEQLIVTHDDSTLYILNLDRLRVEAVARGFRKILDFSVCDNEIFVLEGERSLLRLAPLPEKPNKSSKVIFNPLMPPPVPIMGSLHSEIFEAPAEFQIEDEAVVSAEECLELPPIEKLILDIPIELAVESPLGEQNRRLEIFKQIGEMDFEQSIKHTSGISMNSNKKRRNRNDGQSFKDMSSYSGIVEIGQESKELKENKKQITPPYTTTKSTGLDASYCFTEENSAAVPFDLKLAYTQHFPDVLSPTTLKRTIAEKAKSLAEVLELPEVCLAPITAEELRQSNTLSKPTPPKQTLAQLAQCYPPLKFEESAVQTTPRKEHYNKTFMDDTGDYCFGQPVDNICSAQEFDYQQRQAPSTIAALKFVQTDPVPEEIDSFLLDFRRARDPFVLSTSPAPPESADSNTSSEWEFLDN